MVTRRVTIVGASGTLGREVTRQLLADGWQVVAATRQPERAESLAKAGAEVRWADLRDAASLRDVCRGSHAIVAAAHALLGRGANDSGAVDFVGHRTLIDAARAEGVEHFVYTSVRGASPDHPVDFWRTKFAIERYLERSGVPYTIVRPSAFMETHAHELLGKSVLRDGSAMILGAGITPLNFVSARDVAALIVLILRDRARGETVEIGGPDNVSRTAVAEMYGRMAGRAVKIRRMPVAVLRALAAVTRPVHPGLSRIFRYGAVSDQTDQPFDPRGLLQRYNVRLTRMEDFIRERVAEYRRS